MPTRIGSKARQQRNKNGDRDERNSNNKVNTRTYDWPDYDDPSCMDEEDDVDMDENDDEYFYTPSKSKRHYKSSTKSKQQENKSKSISSDDNAVFDRCQQPISFADDPGQEITPLADSYAAVVRAQFNVTIDRPENHTNVKKYELCVYHHVEIPYYKKRAINSKLPDTPIMPIYVQRNVSLLPILISAHRNKIDILQYDVVSERNSFRKIAMNNKNYVIGVERLGRTLFLRRYDNRITNLNDQGHRFEQMCTAHYNSETSYYHMVEGNIGGLKTLISAEIDAIDKVTGQSIELKSRVNNTDIRDPIDFWLQAFLGGVPKIVVGSLTTEQPRKLVAVREQNVVELVDNRIQNLVLRFLHEVLRFLQGTVEQNTTYLLSRRYDQRNGRHGLHLYKVANKDKHELSFISRQMLNEIGFKV